jgi:raffinose/stachyose/melibiose transport system permease protein/N-acetylglucosamine transport system permease protein
VTTLTTVQKKRVSFGPLAGVRRPRFTLKNTLIYLFLGSFCVTSILAFAWVTNVSLKTNQEFMGTPPWSLPQAPQFKDFRTAWDRGVSTMFQNSLLVASLSTIFAVSIACLAAYPIARIPFRWNQHVLMFFLLGIMIPYMLTAIPLYFAIEEIRQEVTPIDSRLILILLYTVIHLPFDTFVMTGFFKTLPTELEEAAAVDGASPFRTFWQVMLPLATPGIASLTILNFLGGWNEFFYALIFVKKDAARTVPLGLFYLDQQAQYAAKWVNLFAGMMISIVPVLIVFALLQEQITKGLTVGALKG